MRRFAALGFLVLLVACCPAVLQEQPTAFRADVLGTTPSAALLQLRRDASSPLLSVAVTGATLEAADGTPLTLAAFKPGDSVYLTGTISTTKVKATEIQRLD